MHNFFVMSVASKVWITHYYAGNTVHSTSAINFKNIPLFSHTQAQTQPTAQEELIISGEEHA
jgi:hypothetical protein